MPVAREPLLVAKRLRDRLAERDPDVFNRVVGVDVQIAVGAHREIDHGMARELIEHVV